MAFQDIPIKRKVMAVIMLTSIIALVLTAAAFMVYDALTYRQTMVRNLSTSAAIIADNSTAVLAFPSPDEAEQILAALKAEPNVVIAALYDDQGNLFVRYPARESAGSFPVAPEKAGHRFVGGNLIFFQPVVQNDKRLGTLYLKSNLGAFYGRLRLYGEIALLVLLGSALVALGISNALQRSITRPILALAEAAKVVSERGDYSVRARKVSGDELGLLTDAFNQMLTRIQEQTVALREREEQLRLTLSASRIGAWDWNVKSNTVTGDDYVHTLFGLAPGVFDGPYDYFLSLIHPEDRAGFSYAVTRALEQRGELNYEFRVLWPDGSAHHLGTRGTAFYDPRGQPARLRGVFVDITDRKQSEEVRSFLAAIVESSVDAIVGMDLEGKVVSWNAGAQIMFGYSAAEMLGQSILRVVSPDRPEEERGILEEVKQGRIRHFETARLHKDGRLIDVSLTVSPIKNARGDIIGMSSIARDISGRKRAERELQEGRARLSGVIGSAMDAIISVDAGQRITMFNESAEKMFRCPAKEAIGQPLDRFIPARFRQAHGRHVEAFGRTGVTSRAMGSFTPISGLRTTGEEFPIEASISQVEVAGQKIYTVILRDVTERLRAEQQIRQMNVELEQRVQDRTAALTAANKELEAFTYSVAHDLRAPLRHIDAFTRILKEDFNNVLPAEAQHYLENISHGSRNMSRLVDDLLNLARVGRQEIKRLPTPLGGLVEEVLAGLKDETEGRVIEWRVAPLPTIECDPGLMKQVFANLLSNAVKYTRPRPVAVIEVGEAPMNGAAALFVRDNGVGFNMKYVDKLFGVFSRLHRAEDFEGTGVGLATVQRIIRKHGGNIWAEGAVDEGAVFYFTLGGLGRES